MCGCGRSVVFTVRLVYFEFLIGMVVCALLVGWFDLRYWFVGCVVFVVAFDSGAIPVGVLVVLVCGVVGLRIALCVGSLDYAGGFGFCVAWFCVAWVGF